MRKECLNTVYKLAQKDKKVIFIGSDLGPGVLSEFKEKIPKRFFMEGVAEQSIIGLAAGLAMDGYKPFVNTIATFITRRCFEQVCIDLCLHNLPVRLIGNGGGLVYAPLGPTHQATDDISIMRTIPNISIISPCDATEMRSLVRQINKLKSPVYVRVGRGGEKIVAKNEKKIIFGKANILKKPKKIAYFTTGVMAQKALEASKILDQKHKIKDVGVIQFGTIKPLDHTFLKKWIPKLDKIVIVEENYLAGGFGSCILEFISDKMPEHFNKAKRIGLGNKFVHKYGTQDELFDYYGLNPKNLVNKVLK